MDADANLEDAVAGVTAAAFGFQGQKCSACSRAIIDEKIYDKFLEKLKARVETLTVGDPAENPNMGAVINEGSMKDILGYIEHGKKDGRLITGGQRQPGDGFFIQPTVIADIARQVEVGTGRNFWTGASRDQVEEFRPCIGNCERYRVWINRRGLQPSREKLDRAVREFHVGNLYLNRKCTGATVGAHPFGGFNMSGTDSKSGGPDYLYLFTQAKSVGEKV